jgi:hypothetical protein
MSTSTITQSRPATASPVVLRVSSITFAAAYGIAMFVPSLPEGGYSDARVLALMEGGDATRIILGGYALVVAACALLVFVAALRARLGAEPRSMWDGLIQMSAGVFATLLLVAATLFSSIPFGVALGELEAGDDPALYRAMSNGGFHVLLVGGLGVASVLVATVSLALRRLDEAPRWVSVLGFVIAPLLLLGAAWVPQFLVPLWAVAVGVTLGRR